MKALAFALLLAAAPAMADGIRATGDLGLVIERATGSLLVVDRSDRASVGRIEGLGDLSHATLTYSPDERFAYVFGRDGGLTKVDMLSQTIAKRIVQGGNSIGGAISDDGKLIAVSNYEPGGVKVFDAETLELVADIPAGAKTIGLVDVPGRRFAWATWETGEAFLADFSGPEMVVTKLGDVGRNPFDAVLTDDAHTFLIGLFGEKGVTAIDLWDDKPAPVRFLKDYGKTEDDLPVYKMPHLQGWAFTEGQYVLPAVGQHELLWVNRESLQEVARTPVHGQPVFIIAQPGSPYVWVNFATPLNDTVQVVDSRSHEVVRTLTPGAGVLHMEFAPRGAEVWISARDDNRVMIYDTHSLNLVGEIAAESPSGIFFTARAHRIGL
ncbi:MAG: protein nirF [Rhodobacteraceae bacterium]|jgi:protein NirF|uniref:cytochrome D1 domain-containing protein n=1 Tax=Albidovulum sp. TaxID=1872424 RepID=UPI001D1BD94A|nr:cytochrome D1 domain-containing protein [uncultured Defluviimonas sp.]MCB2125608.1 protein nirF [Paracoccaceae bacterium]MCC0071483.1 protein nirF [Paracoccaceae bacterium]